MDPITLAGIVESSLGLALQFGSAAKSLRDIAGKYKNAKLTVQSLAQNLDILQLTWTQIGQWFEDYKQDRSLHDDDLVKRVNDFLDTGTLVMEALGQDLLAYDVENLNFTQRSKLIWNESALQGHQIRIRDQTLSMSLFLQAVKLPTPKAQAKLLRKSEDQFRRSDESAYSINSIRPSHLSLLTERKHSLQTSSKGSLEYRSFSFENQLLTSQVYIRTFKSMMNKKIFRVSKKSKEEIGEMMQPVPGWEAIRNELDADSVLISCGEASAMEVEFSYLINTDKSPTPLFEHLLLGIADYISNHIEPQYIQNLTPVKLAAFYRLVGGDYDSFFLDCSLASLSSVYQWLGCYHTLQPETDPHTPPTIPALTPGGFVRWQTFQLLLEPDRSVPVLQEAVKRFDLTNPVDGSSFPRVLPKESLPHEPDVELVEWYENMAERLRSEVQTLNDSGIHSALNYFC